MKTKLSLICLMALMFLILPELSLASGGLTEFSSPLEKLANTISGPMAKIIAIIVIAAACTILAITKEDLAGFTKTMIYIAIAISGAAGATSIVGSLFSFQGALV